MMSYSFIYDNVICRLLKAWTHLRVLGPIKDVMVFLEPNVSPCLSLASDSSNTMMHAGRAEFTSICHIPDHSDAGHILGQVCSVHKEREDGGSLHH